MDDSIAYQTVVVLNVSRLSRKGYKERGQNVNSEKTFLNNIFSKLKTVCSLANVQEVVKPMTPSVSRPAKFVVFYLLGKDENETVRILSQ